MKQPIIEANGISITKNLIGINYTKGMLIKPKYIVIHDVSDTRFTTMREYRNYIARNKEAKKSIHYLVGPRNIIKILEDEWRGWHVADNPSKEITNSNSIAIAMFIRDNKDIKRTLNNVVDLVNKLRENYDISFDNVKRHYDVTGKLCPQLLLDDGDWNDFKLSLEGVDVDFNLISKCLYEHEERITEAPLRNEVEDITEEEALEEIRKFYINPCKTYNALEELQKLSEENVIEINDEENNSLIKENKVSFSTVKIDINREGTVINIDTNLSIRRDAEDNSYVIGYLLAAETIDVIEEVGKWYKIIYQSTIGKRIGFVEKKFIKLK